MQLTNHFFKNFISSYFIVLIFSTYLMAQDKNCSKATSRKITKADHAFQKKDFHKTEKKYKQAIQKSPTCGLAYYKLAKFYEQYRPEEALNNYKIATIYSPADENLKSSKSRWLLFLAEKLESEAKDWEKVVHYYELALQENPTDEQLREKRINALEQYANQLFTSKNFKKSLEINTVLTDLYYSAQKPISCQTAIRRIKIYQRFIDSVNNDNSSAIEGKITRINDLLNPDFESLNCPDIKPLFVQLVDQRIILKTELATLYFQNKNYKSAIELANQVLITSSNDPALNNLYNKIRLEYANYLIYVDTLEENSCKKGVELLHQLSQTAKDDNQIKISKLLLRDAYLMLAKYAKKRKKKAESLDYINRVLLENPTDTVAQKLKSEVFMDFGRYSFQEKQYDIALFYFEQSKNYYRKDDTEATLYIASLHESNFDFHIAKFFYEEVAKDKSATLKQIDYAKKQLMEYGKLEKDSSMMNYLWKIFCETKYDSLKTYILSDTSGKFDYLRKNPEFDRWVNRVRRIKFTNVSMKTDYTKDENGIIDPYLHIFYNGLRMESNTINETTNPMWSFKQPAVIDYREGDFITFKVMEGDFSPDDLLAIFNTTLSCSQRNYELNEKVIEDQNYDIKLRFIISDARNESLYRNDKQYPISNFQIASDLGLCLLKTELSAVPFFFLVVAEDILIKNRFDATFVKEQMEETVKKILKNYFLGDILVYQINTQITKIIKKFDCFYTAFIALKAKGWFQSNYDQNGKRKLPVFD